MAVTCLALLLATGCSSGSTGPSYGGGGNTPPPSGNGSGSTSNSITIGNNIFTPSSTTVPVNTTVTWTWDSCGNDGYGGTTCVSHSVTFDDGVHSDTQSKGSYSRTFATAGTYTYHCSIHGAAMAGKVVVQ
jgi:plastocyanin